MFGDFTILCVLWYSYQRDTLFLKEEHKDMLEIQVKSIIFDPTQQKQKIQAVQMQRPPYEAKQKWESPADKTVRVPPDLSFMRNFFFMFPSLLRHMREAAECHVGLSTNPAGRSSSHTSPGSSRKFSQLNNQRLLPRPSPAKINK